MCYNIVMKLNDNYDDNFEYGNERMSGTAIFILVSLFILLILAIVLVISGNANKKKSSSVSTKPAQVEAEEETDIYGMPSTESILGGEKEKLHPDDLEIFSDYNKKKNKDNKETTDTTNEKEKEKEKEASDKKSEEKDKDKDKEKTEEDKDAKDPSDDGKHTLVKYRDGTEEWVAISNYLTRNNYDLTKFVIQNGILKYEDDGKNKSFWGTDISRYQGTVDFYALKDAGIDFVMLKVGGRGYSSGTVTIDECFADNIEKATNAGLGIGLYFYSQAVTVEEAAEEANVVLDAIGEYKITYPIGYDMEFVDNDTARIEGLSKADKTNIAKTFMDAISAKGYRPSLYGNKEWLIKEVDLTKLSGYEVWLSQPGDLPDYPYKFSMWQYSTSGKVNGITGPANLNICFVDYSNK